MLFNVIDLWKSVPKKGSNSVYLVVDNWDDWGKYRTQFQVVIYDQSGKRFEPGSIKIGEFGLKPSIEIEKGYRAPTIESKFDSLADRHFSLGQDETYYETLNDCSEELRRDILIGLRDCAFDIEIFESAKNEEVMSESLLRDVREKNVRNRYHRLARGDVELTEFHFKFKMSAEKKGYEPSVFDFHVFPNSVPPTNVHVLIGRNGVGKTFFLKRLSEALICGDSSVDTGDKIIPVGENSDEWSFASLLAVTFSAFDNFELPEIQKPCMRSSIIGLRSYIKENDKKIESVKTPEQLADDFSDSFKSCRQGLRVERWRSALGNLENDPLFAEANVTSLLNINNNSWIDASKKLFSRLSSGHAIVLLTITRLVELVDEKTIVLLDEPESHLHPPLLSAFIRSLSNLLISRNGVAIVATHSPVVLQEVPKACVWMLRRSGYSTNVTRPGIETFGENVGVLTREAFGLEVTNSGYHTLLRHAIDEDWMDYDEILQLFQGQIGAEARAIVRCLIADRDSRE